MGGNPVPFAVCYSLGNLIALASTGFIVGPWRQCKNMFAGTRFVCTCVFFLSIGATLFVCFQVPPEAPIMMPEPETDDGASWGRPTPSRGRPG